MQTLTNQKDREIQPDTIYSEDEAAVLLVVKSRTLEYWRQTGKGPKYVRLGPKKHVKYLGKYLLDHIKLNSFASTSEEASRAA